VNEILQSIRRGRRRKGKQTRSKAWRWRVGAALLALAATTTGLWLAASAFVRSGPLRVRHVIVLGIERLDGQRVHELAEAARERPILLVDLDDLRSEIESVPGVQTAVVARRMPDVIEVRVKERQAVARVELGRRSLLVDATGALFAPAKQLESDRDLPAIKGLRTPPDGRRLSEEDSAALRALEALVKVTGRKPPAGTVVDLTPSDRIYLRPGPNAPALWLDRDRPERNLEDLFVWKESVTRVAGGRAIDLRFPHRLTVVTRDDGSEKR
jgi:cell division septal protein FtsQ